MFKVTKLNCFDTETMQKITKLPFNEFWYISNYIDDWSSEYILNGEDKIYNSMVNDHGFYGYFPTKQSAEIALRMYNDNQV